MTRYFFHVRNAEGVIQDVEGIDIPEGEALHDEAVEAARDLLALGDREGSDRRDWVFEIVDESGQSALTLAFADAAEEAANELHETAR
jgi:hypothetical protein